MEIEESLAGYYDAIQCCCITIVSRKIGGHRFDIVADDEGGWIHFDYVPGESSLRAGCADVTGKLCVIGAQLDTFGVAKLFGV